MEIRSSKLFKQQVTDLVCYLKVTFGKRIAFRVKSEIEKLSSHFWKKNLWSTVTLLLSIIRYFIRSKKIIYLSICCGIVDKIPVI